MAQPSHLWGAGASWATQAGAIKHPARRCNAGQVDSFRGAGQLMQNPYRAWPASASRSSSSGSRGALGARGWTIGPGMQTPLPGLPGVPMRSHPPAIAGCTKPLM
jgi:hypothetical protein